MNIKMRYPGGRAAALTLSYDDGADADIRLIEIMTQYGLKGTFNLNSRMFLGDKSDRGLRLKKVYIESGNEVACHGVWHPRLEQLPTPAMIHEILDDRELLEEEFDTIIRGMAYPYGTYNKNVIEVIRLCGICYARTVRATGGFDIPENWLELPATCHHDDDRLFVLAERFVNHKEDCDPMLFYLWGHSFEFNNNDNWDRIEKFGQMVGHKQNIWYATNIEVYDYIQAYKRLEMSAKCNIIHNPSAMDVWIRVNGVNTKIAAGQTVRFE